MGRPTKCTTVHQLTASLAESHAPQVGADIAAAALSATRKAFGARPLTRALEPRVRAYFEAVVRRRVLRRGGPRDAAARLVIAAVIDDLRAGGRAASDVIEELERGWRDKVPDHVIEEFRTRLCA